MAVHYPADHNIFAVVCLDDPACSVKDPSLLRYAQDKLGAFADRFGDFIATAESDTTLAAMRDLEQMIGKPIDWVRGPSFDTILSGRQTRLPSRARRYCTEGMKITPLAEHTWIKFGGIVEMRIGFRADEFRRVDRMKNNPESGIHKFCVAYNLKTRKHRWQKVEYRKVTMPLSEDGVTKTDVGNFWRNRGIVFPEVSNCVGCFHKAPRVINAQFTIEPEKMRWFAEQERQGKGTWHDDKRTYYQISQLAFTGRLPLDHEMYQACDTGGCTD